MLMDYGLAVEVSEDEDWQYFANCRGLDTECFFPEGGSATRSLVRAVCKECPVKRECLEMALENEGNAHRNDRFGFFGGMSPAQRYDEYRSRRDAGEDFGECLGA